MWTLDARNGDTLGSRFIDVVTNILGWQLDSDKEDVGDNLLLLGLQVALTVDEYRWKLNHVKAATWADDLQKAVDEDHLPPVLASKFYGRLSFLKVVSTTVNLAAATRIGYKDR